ncbi:mechanosensitive ion channel family protein [Dyella terrae]|uniref:Mechanosensing system component YbdG n=3 Tax=Rhodanobacteraceae TaxID=1775411 RepID=A0A4R0YUD4_9GAMM|nr:mechanosensitive ion channel family protein [Dyella terrae]TCI08727.1 mechanosensitive ion channel family protein [Dyella soli]
MRGIAAAVLIVIVAWITGVLTRTFLSRVVHRVTLKTAWRWDDALFERGTFRWLGRMVPTIVIQFGVPLIPGLPANIQQLIVDVATALMVLFAVMAVSSMLSAIEDLYRQGSGQRSIKGVMQLLNLALFISAALVIIVSFTGRSVGWMLSGIGAMSAVLMLVFKDTILGFVAGLQLSSNDMLRVGDWITMPSAGADGDVIDITLYTVKVRNFDKTIVTIPTWKMISESYQNWRGMSESGGRRIKRALYIDAASVHFLEDDELASLTRLRLLREYLGVQGDAIARWNRELGDDAECEGNRRRMTNLGTFRAYVTTYLQSHPDVHEDMTCMVRQLQADEHGVPLEIYCFANTTVWAKYETIQADIFDHLIALLPEFGLRMYQQPSGHDVREVLVSAAPGRAE